MDDKQLVKIERWQNRTYHYHHQWNYQPPGRHCPKYWGLTHYTKYGTTQHSWCIVWFDSTCYLNDRWNKICQLITISCISSVKFWKYLDKCTTKKNHKLFSDVSFGIIATVFYMYIASMDIQCPGYNAARKKCCSHCVFAAETWPYTTRTERASCLPVEQRMKYKIL